MRFGILLSLILLSACGYPISDSHDIVYSPTIVSNSNVPVPNQNWNWNKDRYEHRGNEHDDDVPLYYRHRPYFYR